MVSVCTLWAIKNEKLLFCDNSDKYWPIFVIFFTVIYNNELRNKNMLKFSPHLKSYAALPCEAPSWIFVWRSMTTHLHTRDKTMNKTRTWCQNLAFYVLDGCLTFLRHIFRPYISVHFRNLFVSHIALPVKSDIKKPCQQHIQVRCP